MLAYLDPGAGSSITALVASGAVGIGVAWKVARQRMAAKFRRTEATQAEANAPIADGR